MDLFTRKTLIKSHMLLRVLYSFFVLLCFSLTLSSQESIRGSGNNESIWLINGPVYYESNPFAAGDSYFYNEFSTGSIFTCNRDFHNVLINYDLVDQNLVVLKLPDGQSKIPVLISSLVVDSFSIGENLFVNTKKYYHNLPVSYALVVNQGNAQMLMTFRKEFIKNYSQNNEYGMISDVKQSLYIVKNNRATIINSFRSFKKLYPANWQDIRSYIKSKNLKFKNVRIDQLNELMNYCNKL